MSLALIQKVAAFPAGSVLTLVLPLGALIAVVIWYLVLWRRGAGDS
ncbi:MAG: hypothetical protein WCK97_04180 [Actinomycetes bacterium]